MKISFFWNDNSLCCNSCPFTEWDENDYGFRCSLTGEEILTSDYNFDNPNERHTSCPLIIEEES